METIIRNFASVIRRFKVATLLNLLGLSVAFAAFVMIMMQIKYDRNFDKCHQDYENIFRVEPASWETATSSSVTISRPLSEQLEGMSSHIKQTALISMVSGSPFISVEKDGNENFFMEDRILVTPSYTDIFLFDMKEGESSALVTPDNVLIPESMAEKFFGKESALGKNLKNVKDSLTWVVGGVFKDFPENSSVKNGIYVAIPEDENKNNQGAWNYTMFVKLDSPLAVNDIITTIDEKRKESGGGDGKSLVRFTPLLDLHYIKGVEHDTVEKSSIQTIAILFSIAIIILVIAGINFANFNTALTPMRIKSINTQKIMGATNGMMRFSLLMEAVFMTIVAWIFSLLIVYILAQTGVSSLIDANMAFSANYSLWCYSFFIALAVGVLSGLYPAFYMTSFPAALLLKGSFGLSTRGRRLRNLLVGVQFVSSFILIIGAMFMSLQNHFMKSTSLGYDKDEIIVTDLNNTVNKNIEAFSDKIKSFSENEDIAFAEVLLSGHDRYMTWGREYMSENITYQCLPVSYNFLKTMGIKIVDGRDFIENDQIAKKGRYIFNEKAKNDYGLELGGKISDEEIIGFMPNVSFASFRQEMSPMAFYISGTDSGRGFRRDYAYIRVKAEANMFNAIDNVKSTLGSFDGEYPFDVRFYDDVLNNLYTKERSMGMLIILFSVIAVLISIVGVFGLVVFESEYRRKEIGLRKVMGSTVSQILVMFNKTYVKILAVCFVVAVPIVYYVVSKWLESFVNRTPLYWWVFVAAFVLIFIVTMCTVTFQNWRSANENPVKSIKTQ